MSKFAEKIENEKTQGSTKAKSYIYANKDMIPRTITVDREVWERTKQLAAEDNRPVSNYIVTLLMREIKKYDEEHAADKKNSDE